MVVGLNTWVIIQNAVRNTWALRMWNQTETLGFVVFIASEQNGFPKKRIERVYKESRSGTDMSEMCSEKNGAGQDPGFCAWEFDWSSSGLTACCSECGAELDGNWDGRLDWWPDEEE